MLDPRDLAISLLSKQSERDKQISIGASNASNPCTRCLADDMVGIRQPQGKYYMGAVIGTAIHGHLELQAQGDPNLLTEQRVIIGEIDGYGEVKSTSDLFVVDDGLVVDWKTTTKKKMIALKDAFNTAPSEYDTNVLLSARSTAKKYTHQMLMYGMGIENLGYKVNAVVPVFIARDATSDSTAEVWAPDPIPYLRSNAEKVFGRVKAIWAAVQSGRDVETFVSHPQCYYCNVVRS